LQIADMHLDKYLTTGLVTTRKFCDGVRKTGIGVVYSPAS
jgi:hypothetical protein